ncbi:MAG TPA: sulfotransferase [Rhizomicrobium sp.]|nr:sulfotransferase [Rhizomicrobium sp.]
MSAGRPEPSLTEAASALREDRNADAEALVRRVLSQSPDNVDGLKMLAEIAIRSNCHADALDILKRCVSLAPDFFAARYRYATLLYQMNRPHEALREIERLLREDPRNFECLSLEAIVLARTGDHERAFRVHEQLILDYPERPGVRLNYASDLKTAGRQPDSIKAYRDALAKFPGLVEAYWSLGNFKTFRFERSERDAMEAELAKASITDRERCLLHFTLGKAEEDASAFVRSFEHYQAANALRRAAVPYDPPQTSRFFAKLRDVFTPEFLSSRDGVGSKAADPIFVVGMPRSGSTLIEQILSCHPAVETTTELPNIPAIAERLDGPYPEIIRDLDTDVLEALGEEFLEDTRVLRPLGRARFVDKMPENFAHIGLIHLILPNARIIDARRHPLACGLSIFRQDFESGYAFANDLADIGQYYRDYVELMAHFDTALPGKIHRIIYEQMVADPEAEIRRMLSYLGLPFDERCLRFYENYRAVLTASSEQVRRPIFTEALAQWRNYEPWLEPLKTALGPVLSAYPAAPAFTGSDN